MLQAISLEIYWFSKVSWFGHKHVLKGTDEYGDYYEHEAEKWTVASGVAGIGATYYFNPTAPSWFLSGGLGYSSWLVPFEAQSLYYYDYYYEGNTMQDSRFGLGLFIGGGYEFTKHLNVEMDLCWGNPKHSEEMIEVSSNTLTLKCTINALAY